MAQASNINETSPVIIEQLESYLQSLNKSKELYQVAKKTSSYENKRIESLLISHKLLLVSIQSLITDKEKEKALKLMSPVLNEDIHFFQKTIPKN